MVDYDDPMHACIENMKKAGMQRDFEVLVSDEKVLKELEKPWEVASLGVSRWVGGMLVWPAGAIAYLLL